MSPTHNPKAKSRGGLILKLLIPIVVLAGAGVAYMKIEGDPEAAVSVGGAMGTIKYRVSKMDLTVSALAPGELRTKNMIEIRNPVSTYRQMKITWLINEGVQVKKGDELIKLDTSELEESYLKQKIQLTEAQQKVIEAEGDLRIAEKKLETDLLAASNKVEIAKVEIQKYEEGDFPQLVRTADSKLVIAEEELRRAEDRLTWTQKLREKEYVTEDDLEADQFAVQKRKVDRDLAEQEGKLLKEYTKRQEIMKLQTALVEAEGLYEQTKLAGERDIGVKKANLAAAKEKADLELITTNNLKQQLDDTTIRAPEDGLVVYYKDRNRWGQSDSILQVGTTINPRQRLIDLPDFSSWIIEARVHESMIRKIQTGQMAFVTLDALPEELLQGRLSKISVLPDQSNFMRDTQEYVVEIDLSRNLPNFKPGMSGKSEIIIKDLKDVIAVPVQAVQSRDGKTIVYVSGESGPYAQEVEVGENNDSFIEIKSGLQEGQEVLLDKSYASGSGLGNRPAQLASPEARQEAGQAAQQAETSTTDGVGSRGDGQGEGGRRRGGRGGPDDGNGGANGGGRGFGGPGGGRGNFDPSNMTPEMMEEARKRLEERMQNASPEERQMMEQRMQQMMQMAPGAAGGEQPRATESATQQDSQ